MRRERTLGVPKKTFEDTKYCFQLWEAWEHRNTTTAVQIGSIVQMSNSELQHWLTLFILEVRKQDGSVFPLASLHHITAGLMRHLRWNGRPQVDLFRDCDFHDFRASLNAEMKKLQQEGVEAKKRQAEVLTEANEELMWNKGLLGDATPQSLLDTVIFYNGLFLH